MAELLRALDRRAFLGFKVWEFAFHSLFRPYGRWFLRSIVARHPRAVWRGLMSYREMVRKSLIGGEITPVGGARRQSFVEEAASMGKLLLAPGFCQKPFDCPAGRFNHRCVAWEGSGPPPVCRSCYIFHLGSLALKAGASLYIMTSALDIGRHLLLPSLEERLFTHIIACVCPYSLHPFSLALEICRLQGYVVSFARGACASYADWSRADEGVKPDRTFLSAQGREWMEALLEDIALRRGPGKARALRYQGPFMAPSV